MISHSAPKIKAPSPVFVGNRAVGHVVGNTFAKTVRGSKHMLRSPLGWASDLAALESAQRAGASHIEVTDSETGAVYRASIAEMLDRGIRFDRGYGPQVTLPIDKWMRRDQGEQATLFDQSPFLQEPSWWAE